MIRVVFKADSRYPFNRKKLREVLDKKFKGKVPVQTKLAIGVVVVGKRKMDELRKKYKDTTGEKILVFSGMEGSGMTNGDLMEGEAYGGEVVICYPEVVQYSLKEQVLLDKELRKLTKIGFSRLFTV